MNWSSAFGTVKSRYVFMGILFVQLILGVVYTAAVPLWQEHEADYYTVVRFLVQNGRLPTASDYPEGDAEIRQATQPPLYFLLAYPLVAALDDAQPVPPGVQPNLICVGDNNVNAPISSYPITSAYLPPVSGSVAGGYALRLLNVLLGIVATVLTYQAGKMLFPAHPMIALVAAALLAFEGNIVRLSGDISNDMLLVALSAANLLICTNLMKRFSWQAMLLLLVTVGLALLTRLQGWALLIFDIPFILFIGFAQWRIPLRTRLRTILLTVGVLLLVGAAVALFNQVSYGSVLGRYSVLGDVITSSLRNFKLPWVTVAGVANFSYAVYQEPLQTLAPRETFTRIYGLLLLVSVAGVFLALLQAAYQRNRSQLRALLILSGMLLAAVLLVIFRNALAANAENTTLYSTGVIFAPIRYYAPGLPSAALLISAGLMALVPARFKLSTLNLPGIFVAGCWLIVSALGGVKALRDQPASPVITPAEFAALAGLTAVEDVPRDNTPQVLAYRLNERPTDGMVDLTLYMTTNTLLPLNEYAQIDMVTASGQVLNRCQFLPVRATYPTPLWKPGEIVAAQVQLPNCAEPMLLPPQLMLSWFGAAPQNGEVVWQQTSPVPLGSLSGTLQKSVFCPERLGVIAEGYQIVKFNSPPAVRADETYLPSLNWIVLNPSPLAAERTFTFTHVETGTSYTCIGSPAPQAFDVRIWRSGLQVFFDACSMKFPSDAPLGTYQVAVGITDAALNYLPAVDGNGDSLPGGLVTVGEIDLVS